MPNIHQAFPSKYLRAADLGTTTPNVTIKKVTSETVGEDQRLVVYFAGKEKGLVLNKTNANAIADILGAEDTDNWTGGRIKLITAKVDFQGKRVWAIRIEEADTSGVGKPPARPEPPIDDESDVPF